MKIVETGEYNGELVIIDSWCADYSKPEYYRHYWPTGISAQQWPELVGQPAQSEACGYVYIIGDYYTGRRVSLTDNGSTKAIFVETKPIKKPKWAKEYRDGEWKRY